MFSMWLQNRDIIAYQCEYDCVLFAAPTMVEMLTQRLMKDGAVSSTVTTCGEEGAGQVHTSAW